MKYTLHFLVYTMQVIYSEPLLLNDNVNSKHHLTWGYIVTQRYILLVIQILDRVYGLRKPCM